MRSRTLSALAFALAALVVLGTTRSHHAGAPRAAAVTPTAAADPRPAADAVLAQAFEQHAQHIEVEDSATVVKLLPDDEEGTRHQRFIVRLRSGQSLLIAHNIDLAPRVAPLREGDVVRFHGEYVWTPRGGVVHWTHPDPRGHHENGWIRAGP